MKLPVLFAVFLPVATGYTGSELELKLKYNKEDTFSCAREMTIEMKTGGTGKETEPGFKADIRSVYRTDVKKVNKDGMIHAYRVDVERLDTTIHGINGKESSVEGSVFAGKKIDFDGREIKVNNNNEVALLVWEQLLKKLSLRRLNLVELYESGFVENGNTFPATKTEELFFPEIVKEMVYDWFGLPLSVTAVPMPIEIETDKESGGLKYTVADASGDEAVVKLSGEIRFKMGVKKGGGKGFHVPAVLNIDYTYNIDTLSGKIKADRGKEVMTIKVNVSGMLIEKTQEVTFKTSYSY